MAKGYKLHDEFLHHFYHMIDIERGENENTFN